MQYKNVTFYMSVQRATYMSQFLIFHFRFVLTMLLYSLNTFRFWMTGRFRIGWGLCCLGWKWVDIWWITQVWTLRRRTGFEGEGWANLKQIGEHMVRPTGVLDDGDVFYIHAASFNATFLWSMCHLLHLKKVGKPFFLHQHSTTSQIIKLTQIKKY